MSFFLSFPYLLKVLLNPSPEIPSRSLQQFHFCIKENLFQVSASITAALAMALDDFLYILEPSA
jgi:hypothetical protein